MPFTTSSVSKLRPSNFHDVANALVPEKIFPRKPTVTLNALKRAKHLKI
jgi:hypothetical protein